MRFSIITAAFNSEETISDTLRSVNAQTHDSIDHLIIDGGSSDATLEIVKSVGQRVGHVRSGADKGIYDAMNKGLAAATGDVIGILNSDDLYASPDVIAKVAEVFSDDPSVQAVYGDLCYVRQSDVSQVVRYWKSSAYKPGMFQRGWVPPHPTFFARRQVYQQLGGFNLDYKLAADWELLARFIEVHGITTRYLHETMVLMRLGGATNKSLGNIWQQNREIWSAARANGMRPAISSFVVGKLWSRAVQFYSRTA